MYGSNQANAQCIYVLLSGSKVVFFLTRVYLHLAASSEGLACAGATNSSVDIESKPICLQFRLEETQIYSARYIEFHLSKRRESD